MWYLFLILLVLKIIGFDIMWVFVFIPVVLYVVFVVFCFCVAIWSKSI